MVAAVGFVRGYSWQARDVLAWGVGTRASAKATAAAWLNSSPHRAIMLSATYHWVGIGRNCGRFLGYAHACIWTADAPLGRRAASERYGSQDPGAQNTNSARATTEPSWP
jgi:hypothetical protein